jgi:hypothetical protein
MPNTASKYNFGHNLGIELRNLHTHNPSQAPSHYRHIRQSFHFAQLANITRKIVEACHMLVVTGVTEAS